jgi:hypothetical protein
MADPTEVMTFAAGHLKNGKLTLPLVPGDDRTAGEKPEL